MVRFLRLVLLLSLVQLALLLFPAAIAPAAAQATTKLLPWNGIKSSQKISNSSLGLKDIDYFGRSVASLGDLDGDSVADLAVGASNDDDGGTDRGAVWILFLNRNGTTKGFQKISDAQGLSGLLNDSDNFGISVASLGDLNGDSVVDLAVGAISDDDGGPDRGAVWILFLNKNGTARSFQKISSIRGGFTGLLNDSDAFGTSVAALGDLDGDSIVDLAVGARHDDDGGTDRGAVWILFLNRNGTTKSFQKISSIEGGFTGLLDDHDRFGISVTFLGDLNGDSLGELVVGAYYDDDGGPDHGAVWILSLARDGTTSSSQKISDTEGGFTGVLNSLDYFGISVDSLGDLDGDSVVDLAVGASGDDDGDSDRGAVWILFLNRNGTTKRFQKLSDTQGGFTGVLDNSDAFGISVTSVGDLNGDSVMDFAVGAYFDDDGGPNRGAVWIVFGNSSSAAASSSSVDSSSLSATSTSLSATSAVSSSSLIATSDFGSTSSASQDSSQEASTSPADSGSLTFIIAGVVAGLVVCLVVCLAVFYWRRRRQQGSRSMTESDRQGSATDAGAHRNVELKTVLYEDLSSPSPYAAFEPYAPTGESSGVYHKLNDVRLAASAKEVALVDPDLIERHEVLGSGAFGEVYRGTYREKEVAIKHLVDNFGDAGMADFLAEAELMKALPHHKNIIQFIGLVSIRGLHAPAIVVEYCAGNSLESYLDKHGPQLGAALTLLRICRGMEALAAAKITHRDLASRNVLLAGSAKSSRLDDLIPKISDFGMSRLTLEEGGTTKSNFGPIRFMAPEALNHEYSEKSDVWMFGATAVETLTATEPFPGVANIEVAIKVSQGRTPEIPREADTFYHHLASRIFQFSPAERPTFAELVNIFEEFV